LPERNWNTALQRREQSKNGNGSGASREWLKGAKVFVYGNNSPQINEWSFKGCLPQICIVNNRQWAVIGSQLRFGERRVLNGNNGIVPNKDLFIVTLDRAI
jgi:hypothetical protein